MKRSARGWVLAGAAGVAAVAVTTLTVSRAPSAPVATTSESTGVKDVFTLQPIPGSPVKRVVLSAKAAERLGIDTGQITEKPIPYTQMVGGRIVPPQGQPAKAAPAPRDGGGFGSFAQLATGPAKPAAAPPSQGTPPAAEPPQGPTTGEVWVAITLSPGELERLRKEKPARILPLATRDGATKGVGAVPAGLEPVEDQKRTMLTLYYKVPAGDHGLTLYQRVRVELAMSGSEDTRTVVPYSAVYYDPTGAPWVYVNPEPLTFERQRIAVTRIVGDSAVISDGPAIGTRVVTTGAPLLYGTEVVFKK